MPRIAPRRDRFILFSMSLMLRSVILSLLAVLVSTGLVGCAVFSAGAVAPLSSADAVEMGTGVHHGHAGMDTGMDLSHEASPDETGGHQHDSCDGCENSLLNRATISLDAGTAPISTPMPVFVIPAALQLARLEPIVSCESWPRSHGPPPRPNTLTHQKISLLI